MKKLEAYLKKYPNVEFVFKYDPNGTFLKDNRNWQVRFKAGTHKNVPSRCGYGCETFKDLIDHLINERP